MKAKPKITIAWSVEASTCAGKLASASELLLSARAEGLGLAMRNLRVALRNYDREMMKMHRAGKDVG